jgi:hypothetical protein
MARELRKENSENTVNGIRAYTNDARMAGELRKYGEWNSRLHKRCPNSEGLRENHVISTRHSSTHVGGFCLCRRGFNRRLICTLITENSKLDQGIAIALQEWQEN